MSTARKNSLLPNKPENLAAVRQLLRKKLLEVGLELDVRKKGKVQEKNLSKIQHRQFEIENIKGPESFRSNKLLMSEFKNVFSQNYKQVLSNRQDQRRFSRECVKGLRYNYSFEKSKECSPYSLKDVILKIKENKQTQKQIFVLPEIKVRRKLKSQKNEENNIISIKRLFEHSMVIRKQEKDQRNRRSKTEEKDHFQHQRNSKKILKTTLYKEVAPWDVQYYRDTRIVFN